MLEGYPYKFTNYLKAGSLQKRAERAFTVTPVRLVPPTREHPGQPAYAFGSVEVLLPALCIGAFRSNPSPLNSTRCRTVPLSPESGSGPAWTSGRARTPTLC
ncbi:hypothetical protein PUR49_03410 [Streptomyces sp. BE147]|uniref:hypothetical protein n=1 Tax=Streptomyces sp. BE147 TaxID=3002524 RepID=UPI002E7949F0|nr:hypothetical protein [Streptomyces sp. BE147]MEE1735577.1 hypothetical protein [Streptomyces sp. BE147]